MGDKMGCGENQLNEANTQMFFRRKPQNFTGYF